MIFFLKMKDVTLFTMMKIIKATYKNRSSPLAELYKKNNQQKTIFRDQLIIPFNPSQRHISISHLLSPTHHPPSLHLKLTRSPLLFIHSTHFQVARVKPLAMSHPRSTLHWIQFRLESKTNHIGRWHGDDGFITDDDI